MKDEIKEILNNADSSTKFKMVDEDGTEKEMNIAGVIEQLLNDNKHLLDCITNLQERKITKEDVDKYFEENMCVSFEKFIENWKEQEEWTNYYKEENERLKEEIQRQSKALCINDKLLVNYRDRIDKAIKYLNEPNRDEFDYSITYLLEILQGGDEE